MRTTLTIDDDVAAALDKELRKRSGASLKEVVNELLRTGLYARKQLKSVPRFAVHARSLGSVAGINYDNIGKLLDDIEGPLHR